MSAFFMITFFTARLNVFFFSFVTNISHETFTPQPASSSPATRFHLPRRSGVGSRPTTRGTADEISPSPTYPFEPFWETQLSCARLGIIETITSQRYILIWTETKDRNRSVLKCFHYHRSMLRENTAKNVINQFCRSNTFHHLSGWFLNFVQMCDWKRRRYWILFYRRKSLN